MLIKNHEFILQNDTIGQFLKINKNLIEVNVSEAADVYFQKETLEKRYKDVIET